jgi:hypothetical protein
MFTQSLPLGIALTLGLVAGWAEAQSETRSLARVDAGPPTHVRTNADRDVIQDLELLTNLEVLRDLEMYAPTDGGAPTER